MGWKEYIEISFKNTFTTSFFSKSTNKFKNNIYISMSKIMRVAVIGGGISGMAAAYVLAKEGVEVVVYEKQMSLGGQAKTATIDGTHLDLGFTIFARVCI